MKGHNYMLAADNLAGIERFFDREYHAPANRDPEVTAHLESCLMHLDALKREVALLSGLIAVRRRRRDAERARRQASLN